VHKTFNTFSQKISRGSQRLPQKRCNTDVEKRVPGQVANNPLRGRRRRADGNAQCITPKTHRRKAKQQQCAKAEAKATTSTDEDAEFTVVRGMRTARRAKADARLSKVEHKSPTTKEDRDKWRRPPRTQAVALEKPTNISYIRRSSKGSKRSRSEGTIQV